MQCYACSRGPAVAHVVRKDRPAQQQPRSATSHHCCSPRSTPAGRVRAASRPAAANRRAAQLSGVRAAPRRCRGGPDERERFRPPNLEHRPAPRPRARSRPLKCGPVLLGDCYLKEVGGPFPGADGGRVLGRPGLPSAGLSARRRRPRTADPDGPPRDPHSRRPARSPWPLRATRRSIRARRATSSERRARAGEDHRFVEYGPRRRCGRTGWVPRLAAAVCGVCTSRTWAPACARSHRLEGAFKQWLESRCRRPGTFF